MPQPIIVLNQRIGTAYKGKNFDGDYYIFYDGVLNALGRRFLTGIQNAKPGFSLHIDRAAEQILWMSNKNDPDDSAHDAQPNWSVLIRKE